VTRRRLRKSGLLVIVVITMTPIAPIAPIATIVMVNACSAPEYRFASSVVADSGGGHDSPFISDTSFDSDAPVDAAPAPAAPITPVILGGDASVDFTANCAGGNGLLNGPTNAFVKTETVSGKAHCYLYYASDPAHRTWTEAKTACGAISMMTPPRTAHLATFPTSELATLVQGFFKNGQVPWIGLERGDGLPPADKNSWHWINGDPNTYDGWFVGSPHDDPTLCAAWSGNAQYTDVLCINEKGFLCEIDE